jgi:hypothetical protein
LAANLTRDKHSTIAKLMQYVLIELLRNVFLENTMIDITWPTQPTATIAAVVMFIAFVNVTVDIFLGYFRKYRSFEILIYLFICFLGIVFSIIYTVFSIT